MNIILVNTLYYPYKIGGAEVSVQILAESLIEKGHSVTVVSIHEHNERKDTEHNGVKNNIFAILKHILGIEFN